MSLYLNNRKAMVMGALVADAASLGLHWLYDTKRIVEIEQNAGLVFSSLMPVIMLMEKDILPIAASVQESLLLMVKLVY